MRVKNHNFCFNKYVNNFTIPSQISLDNDIYIFDNVIPSH